VWLEGREFGVGGVEDEPGRGQERLVGVVVEVKVRGGSGRRGFRVAALDGRSGRLASAGGEGGPRVGRYAVHLAELEAVALPALRPGPGVRLLVVDEIGKMECLSPGLVDEVRRALAGPTPFLGTVALSGGGFIAESKRLPGVKVISLTRENRDRLPTEIAARLGGPG
jgi:nucleoside-triphosphatase